MSSISDSKKQQIDANGLLYCYNKGCGQRFNPEENRKESCLYHPGPPYFHDAYKIWKCCGNKSTDFGTWLSYKGCTRGPHNPEKPIEEEQQNPKLAQCGQQQIRPENEEEVIVWNGLNKPAERHATKKPMIPLQVQILEPALKALHAHLSLKMSRNNLEDVDFGAGELLVEKLLGTNCKNNACKAVFTGPEIDTEECVHHPGVAVFHEGMKYWSCCERKTSDFGAFLDQAGCSRGKHCWTKNERIENVREDWFQRGGHVHITLYCKGAIPEGTFAETDGLSLNVTVKHGFGVKETEKHFELFGEIIPTESMVLISERKVELVLKQVAKDAWPKLYYEAEK